MAAYYNEIDPFAAQWLRNLIAAGHIAPGEVDERDIRDVEPESLRGFDQCHFFAGIGGWSHALRLAGWPDGRSAWTGSCPCQPFSSAGRGGGFADERHLWPAFHYLIEQGQPDVVFGEQVASTDGLGWSDLVQADCEGAGYAFRAEDICAAGVGAPHIRQRLWFVAHRRRRPGVVADLEGRGRLGGPGVPGADRGPTVELDGQCSSGPLADSNRPGRGQLAQLDGQPLAGSEEGQLWLDHAGRGDAGEPGALRFQGAALGETNPLRGFWSGADWIYCRDGKYRPVEPGTQPLVDGLSYKLGSGSPFEGKSRVGMLRGYGNAIVPQVASEVVREFMRAMP